MIQEAAMQGWVQRIQFGRSFEALRLARDEIQLELLAYFPKQDAEIRTWYERVNRIQDELIKQAVLLAEQELRQCEDLPPPCPYALLLLGSGGRSERTLWSDQDHALIFRDEHPEAIRYFQQMSRLLEAGLQRIGYTPCDGKVTSANPAWCKSLSAWKKTLADWFSDGSWESVRHLLIAADARLLYGQDELFEAFSEQHEVLMHTTPRIMEGMLRNTLRHKIVLGPLGNLILEAYGEKAGGFDIKYGAYIPMVNAVRLLAIKHRITTTSTLARMEQLQTKIDNGLLNHWREAFSYFLWMRAITPYHLTEEGLYVTTGIVSADQLNRGVKSRLKAMIQIGAQLQRYIQKEGLS